MKVEEIFENPKKGMEFYQKFGLYPKYCQKFQNVRIATFTADFPEDIEQMKNLAVRISLVKQELGAKMVKIMPDFVRDDEDSTCCYVIVGIQYYIGNFNVKCEQEVA